LFLGLSGIFTGPLRVILGIMGVFLGILWYSWVNVWTGDGVATIIFYVSLIKNDPKKKGKEINI
jgi:hypothetical protein